MAARRTRSETRERAFDMRSLIRLGSWGAGATAALALTVLAATSTTGSQRLARAMSHATDEQPSESVRAEPASRTAEVETQRLTDAVRALAADRDRLLTRVASLERGLGDITGSIKRQSSSMPPPENAPPPPAAPAPTAAAIPPAVTPPPDVQPETAAPAAQSNPGPDMPESAPAVRPENQVAEAPAAGQTPGVEPLKSAGEFGVDLGGAANFDGLRELWASTRRANAALFEGLKPLVAVREKKSRGADLRLIVGPLASQEAAARFCATLSTAARRSCKPAPFQGRQLTRASSAREAEHRPSASPRPTAGAPQPQAPAHIRP